jgi:hypothetical protein
MSVANPWAAWLALAALPLFVAFLIRRWRRRRTVPSVVIYRRLLAQTASRSRFARPHHLVALLLTMLALAALILAALQPIGFEVPPRKYVIVLDSSASMGARELGMESTRFTRVVMELAEFLNRLNPADEVALITAGTEATLELGWTRSHDTVLTALTGRRPLGAGTGMSDAVRIADALCQDRNLTEILLVSDGGSLALPPFQCPMRHIPVGESADNVAITGFTVREADALGLNEVYVAVHNAAAGARDVTLSLELDGHLIDVQSLPVAPHTTVERLLRVALPAGGEQLVARVVIDHENALTEDDVAYAVLRPGARVRTLLLTSYPTTFLAEALRLHPRVDLTVVPPEGLAGVTGPFHLLVIDAPYAGPLPRSEHVVVLDAGASMLGLTTSGTVNNPEIIRWSFDHPLFRFVNLDGVRISRATATQLPVGATSLMDMPDGPLAFELEDGGQKLLYFTFHPDRSDLPLRVAFVNLVANLVEWAQPFDARDLRSSIGTGERLATVMPGLTLVPLSGGPRDGRSVDARDPVPAPGVYQLVGGDGTARGLVAANLFSTAEADLQPQRRLGVRAVSGWPQIYRTEAFPWWWLVLAALGLVALEWVLPGLLGLEYRIRKRREERAQRRAHAQPNRAAEPKPATARAAGS